MATLTNPVYYKNGVVDTAKLVGHDGGSNYVVRYTLTIDSSESADHISVFMDSQEWIGWGNYSAPFGEINNKVSLYFIIGTDPDEFVNAGYGQISEATGKVTMEKSAGYSVEENLKYNARFEGDAMLIPGSIYYLWIFPGYAPGGSPGGNYTWGWFGWYDNGAGRFKYTIELSGEAGLVRIDTGTSIVTAVPYIDTGTEWKQIIPYIDTGEALKVCG